MFYDACVPVVLRYLEQLDKLVLRIQSDASEKTEKALLSSQLTAKMLPLEQQVNACVAFAKRACFTNTTLAIPAITYDAGEFEVLRGNIQSAITQIQALTPGDFVDIKDEIITTGAGEADLEITRYDYLHLLALPNFFFHFSMTYAIARHHGIALGKHDFDGFHAFQQNFSFCE